jgi:hypothetical protein
MSLIAPHRSAVLSAPGTVARPDPTYHDETARELRPAAHVMSPARMGAAFCNALSFSRTAIKEIARRRWRVEKRRITLDTDGNGEVLYRIDAGKWQFHFFVISRQLSPDQQIDRNFATRWDATAALCQGPWSPEREDMLRREVPKQLDGWVDYDTLILSRGNRSGRLFEHVVERLAAGMQPDPRQLSEVGYILRTTGFLANGMSGTKPLRGFDSEHPLRRPYHAQMCAAFLFREFVFDLVESMAVARSCNAVPLAPAYKRYLGLGNSAATGMVRYLVNHPRQIHQWCATWEAAFAEAKARCFAAAEAEFRHLESLIAKAALYFRQDGRAATGAFVDASRLADELLEAGAHLRALAEIEAARAPRPFVRELCLWAEEHVTAETSEILHAIALELFPDIVDDFATRFEADEETRISAAMTNRDLKMILRSAYGWALERNEAERSERFFWFHSIKAPQDARRGYRSIYPPVEHENTMETVRQVRLLAAHLELLPDTMSTAEIAARSPAFRQIIARVQSLQNCEYAEMRDNPLDESFYPIPATRFVLAFYGMDKFDAAPPKLVRGALLQGAPTADDIASGIEGSWPFPLFPTDDDANAGRRPRAASAAPATLAAPLSCNSERPNEIVVSKAEFEKCAQRALQSAGAPFGVAAEAARAYGFLEAAGCRGMRTLLDHIAHDRIAAAAHPQILRIDALVAVLDARGGDALVASLPAVDLAAANAERSPNGIGAAIVLNAVGDAALYQVPFEIAVRGLTGAAIKASHDAMNAAPRVAFGCPATLGPWVVRGLSAVDWSAAIATALATLSPNASSATRVLVSAGAEYGTQTNLVVICAKPGDADRASANVLARLKRQMSEAADPWDGSGLPRLLEQSALRGLAMPRDEWKRLESFAARLLVAVSDEEKLREDGFDATKQF